MPNAKQVLNLTSVLLMLVFVNDVVAFTVSYGCSTFWAESGVPCQKGYIQKLWAAFLEVLY